MASGPTTGGIPACRHGEGDAEESLLCFSFVLKLRLLRRIAARCRNIPSAIKMTLKQPTLLPYDPVVRPRAQLMVEYHPADMEKAMLKSHLFILLLFKVPPSQENRSPLPQYPLNF